MKKISQLAHLTINQIKDLKKRYDNIKEYL